MVSNPNDATSANSSHYIVVVGFLIILSSGDEVDGPAAVLGNYQQQNFHIVYDMEKERVGFQPKPCALVAN